MIFLSTVFALPLSSAAEPVPFTQTPMYRYLCEVGRQKSPTYRMQFPEPQDYQPHERSQEQPEKKPDIVPAEEPVKPIFHTVPRPLPRPDYEPISLLTPDTTFAEAIDVLRNSVKPPLNIVVFWKDLEENADVDRNTPIAIQGPRDTTLRKHLQLILASLSATADTELAYAIEDGIIKIATRDSLPKIMKTRVYDITDLTAPPARFFDYGGPYMFLQNRYGSGPGYMSGPGYGYGGYPSRSGGYSSPYGNYPSRYGRGYQYGSYTRYPYGTGVTSGVGIAFR